VTYRLLHYINIVYSKVLQALSIILTNQCDMSKQVLQFGANNDMTKETLTWRENNFGAQSGPTLYIFVVPGGPGPYRALRLQPHQHHG